jgi:HAD superfamily hydrolase (TIGR01509 family)
MNPRFSSPRLSTSTSASASAASANYFNAVGWPASIPEPHQGKLVSALYKRKTDLLKVSKLVESRNLPMRPSVETLIDKAFANGVQVAVCNTSLERAVMAIVHTMLRSDRAHAMKIFTGDVVPNKKSHPAIYELAVATPNMRPDRCVVIEDSQVGLATAKAAGMACIVTTSTYTEREGFAIADTVFPCIGEHPHQHFDLLFELVAGERPNCMIDIWMTFG